MSGAGKTVIGRRLAEQLRDRHQGLIFLDGDVMREIWADNLGHSLKARNFNANRISHLCRMLDQQQIHVVAAVLYPFRDWIAWNRRNLSQFFEVFLDVPLIELQCRDPKGLYAGSREGKIKNVVGVDIPFERPLHPDIVLENSRPFRDLDEIATEIGAALPAFASTGNL